MTHEEIQAEISRLKEEARNTNDLINDLIRGLPDCRKADQQSLKMLNMNLPGRVFLDSENKTNARICEERRKRDELKTKIEELKSQLRAQPKQPIPNTTQMGDTMTNDEIQSEISQLKIEIQKVDDNINDTRETLRWAKREDEKERNALFGKRSSPIGTEAMNRADLQREVRVSKTLREYQEKRIELKVKIEELKAQLRTQPKPSNSDSRRMIGVVKWYNPQKEFGFIRVDGQSDVWVPKSSLMESTSLETGDKVTFKCIQGPKGFKAVDVRYATE